MCRIFKCRVPKIKKCNFYKGFGLGVSLTLIVTIVYIYLQDEANYGSFLVKSLSTNISNEYGLNYNQSEDKLFSEIRIACLVLTSPKNHLKKAIHVKNTWGKRCNKLIFMSTEKDEELGAIALNNVGEGRKFLWLKSRESFKYVFDNHLNDAEWFLKADDDTYVILENLRKFLQTKSPEDPVYYGCQFKPLVDQGYMSGGAGYVLSKEALVRFGTDGLKDCSLYGGSEDVAIGICLEKLGVKPGDSRDDLGRPRFLPINPEYLAIPGEKKAQAWYWRYIYYKQKQGLGCCSSQPISFHYINPRQMYLLEYLIYRVDKPIVTK